MEKSENKDFGGAIVQNQYVFKEYCQLMFKELGLRNHTTKNLLFIFNSIVEVLKYSHITQLPLANFARICKNLLVSGFLKVNELA